MRLFNKETLFSTVILGSVFSDYTSFYGDDRFGKTLGKIVTQSYTLKLFNLKRCLFTAIYPRSWRVFNVWWMPTWVKGQSTLTHDPCDPSKMAHSIHPTMIHRPFIFYFIHHFW